MKIRSYALIAIAAAAIVVAAYAVLSGSSPSVVVSGDNVSVFYTGTFTNGTVFDSNAGQQPFVFTAGSGQVIPGFDNAVLGMGLHESKNVVIPANEAYGSVDPSLIISVPISRFGNQTIRQGMTVTETASSGQQRQGLVTSVNATNATLDFNSPLAGKTLLFNITVVKISK